MAFKVLLKMAEALWVVGEEFPDLRARSLHVVDTVTRLTSRTPDSIAAGVHPLTVDDFRGKGPEVRDALDELIQDAVIVLEKLEEPKPRAAVARAAKSLERAGISGLSANDILLLVLVALLLLNGGDGHPTALGEAVESNQLQIVAIVIALAAYMRKRD
jgi:hypothetical protein